MDYIEASKLITEAQHGGTVSTGSRELDRLLGGGVKCTLFYHFYGERGLTERLFRYLTVNALKPTDQGSPRVAYMVLNNYRKERINLGVEELAELAEESGYNIWEAMNRVRIFTASSADQQTQLATELQDFIEKQSHVSLVLVDGIFKLHRDDARKRGRHRVREEVQRSINALRQQCMSKNIPLVSSGRAVKPRGGLLPRPESSSYLRHTANVIVYLRSRQQGSLFNRAYLIDHPLREPGSIEYRYRVEEIMGRETKPFRRMFQETIERLRKELREPLIEPSRKTAFDHLLEAWGSEQGAMSYAESFKLLDLLFMVSLLDNRSKLDELTQLFREHMDMHRQLDE